MDDIGKPAEPWTDASAVQQVQNGDPHSAETSAAWDYIEEQAGRTSPGVCYAGLQDSTAWPAGPRLPRGYYNRQTPGVRDHYPKPQPSTTTRTAQPAPAREQTPEEQAAAILDVIDQPLFLSEDDLPQYGKPGPYSCSRCLGPRGTRRGTLCVYCALEQEQKQEPKQELATAGKRASLVQQVRQLPVSVHVALLIAFVFMLLVGLVLTGILPG